MKKIRLTQGKYATVDSWNYEWLNQWKWYALKSCHSHNFYAARKIKLSNCKQVTILMHREILGLKCGDKQQADHINHNELDNREENLRICTLTENNRNRISRTGTSKYKGVYWNKGKRKWHAQIGFNGKVIYLGQFISEIKAAKIYNNAALKYHGEYAQLNSI